MHALAHRLDRRVGAVQLRQPGAVERQPGGARERGEIVERQSGGWHAATIQRNRHRRGLRRRLSIHAMHPAIARLPLYAVDELVAAIEADGCALVAEALPAPLCAAARAAIDGLAPLDWDETHADPLGPRRHLDRHLCVFNRDPFWLGFLDRPGVIDLAEALLGVDCHVIGQTAWRSHPGYRGDCVHADYVPFAERENALRTSASPCGLRVPPFVVTVHFHLSDVSPDCAPTRVIPGSHRAGRAPRADERTWAGRDPITVTAGVGDALVFRSDLWHAGSDNRTADSIRYLLQVHYGRREVAQHLPRALDWRWNARVLAAATPRQRRLLGEHPPGPYD